MKMMCHGILTERENLRKMEGIMKSYMDEEEMKEQEQKEYINGLKRFQAKGIPVFIDGEKPEEEDWGKIFQIREDGSFYMSDYIGLEEGALREIRFERVYNK